MAGIQTSDVTSLPPATTVDYKAVLEQLLFVVRHTEESFLELCDEVSRQIAQSTDSPETLLSWVSEQIHKLQDLLQNNDYYHEWSQKQQWEESDKMVQELSIDHTRLPEHQKQFAAACEAEAKGDLMNPLVSTSVLLSLAESHATRFFECVRTCLSMFYAMQPSRKFEFNRIAAKIEQYNAMGQTPGYCHMKDMIRARLDFDSVAAAVFALRDYFTAHACNPRGQCPLEILQIKSNLTQHLRNINVVLKAGLMIGEVQLVVCPRNCSIAPLLHAKLHLLYEITRVCELHKHERSLSPSTRREIVNSVCKLYSWGLLTTASLEPQWFLVRHCRDISKMLPEVVIAKHCLHNLGTVLADLMKTLSTTDFPASKIETLRNHLLDMQALVINCFGRHLLIFLHNLTTEKASTFIKSVRSGILTLRTELALLQNEEKHLETGEDLAASLDSQELIRASSLISLLNENRDRNLDSALLKQWLADGEGPVNLNLIQALWINATCTRSSSVEESDMKSVGMVKKMLQNTISLIKDLVPALEEKKLVQSKSLNECLSEVSDQVSGLQFQLAVMGPMKVGKSALINGLVGIPQLLPERTFPMTVFPIIVQNEPGQRLPVLLLDPQAVQTFSETVTRIRARAKATGLGCGVQFLESKGGMTPELENIIAAKFSLEIEQYFEGSTEAVSGQSLANFLVKKAAESCRKLSSLKKRMGMKTHDDTCLGRHHMSGRLALSDIPQNIMERDYQEQEFRALLARNWKLKVDTVTSNYEALHTMERNCLASILNNSIENELATRYEGEELCRNTLTQLTMIARIAMAFGLSNPGAKITSWPMICVEFRNIIPQLPARFQIVDTPGPDEAILSNLANSIVRLLRQADAVFCVLNATNLQNAQRLITSQIAKVRAIRRDLPNHVTVICNWFDQAGDLTEEDVKCFISNKFDVPIDEVFCTTAKKACLAHTFTSHLEISLMKPEIDFSASSPLREWAKLIYGKKAATHYPKASLDEVKEFNGELLKESGLNKLTECKLTKMACHAGQSVLEKGIERLHLNLETARGSCDSLHTAITGNLVHVQNELDRLKDDKQRQEQKLLEWANLTEGVQLERKNDGSRVLKTIHEDGLKLLEDTIRQDTIGFHDLLKVEINNKLLAEFKQTPKAYFQVTEEQSQKFGNEAKTNDHVLQYHRVWELQSRLRRLSIELYEHVEGRFLEFVSQLSTKLKERLGRLNEMLESSSFDKVAPTLPHSTHLTPFKSISQFISFSGKRKRKLWYMLFLREGEVDVTLYQVVLREVEDLWLADVKDLITQFSEQALSEFRASIDEQRVKTLKSYVRRLEMCENSIESCQQRLKGQNVEGTTWQDITFIKLRLAEITSKLGKLQHMTNMLNHQ